MPCESTRANEVSLLAPPTDRCTETCTASLRRRWEFPQWMTSGLSVGARAPLRSFRRCAFRIGSAAARKSKVATNLEVMIHGQRIPAFAHLDEGMTRRVTEQHKLSRPRKVESKFSGAEDGFRGHEVCWICSMNLSAGSCRLTITWHSRYRADLFVARHCTVGDLAMGYFKR